MSAHRVTLSDVAAKAGVHVTTVSLAMRNHPRLPETTRKRIQALATEMGYSPDPFLRALVSYRGRVMPRRNPPTLAYVSNWTTRWGWKKVTAHPQFYAGAQEAAKRLGFNLEHFWMQEPGLTQGRLSRILYSRGINGVILASHGREMGDAAQLEWQKFSSVKIDYFPHEPQLHNVTNNQCDIVRLAFRKLVAAGYTRIGMVMHRGWDHAVDYLWTAGFLCEQQVLRVAQPIPIHYFPQHEPMDRWLEETKAEVEPQVEPFEAWMRRCKPEVIISKAAFVLPLLQRLGLRVPKDVAFVDLFLEDTDGKVAGVRQNHEAVGALAVELLSGQLQNNKYGIPDIPTTTYVEGTWFDGASCPSLK
jgi:LacI family transcriptional regulator